ncbi:MAG TPA: S8 family serine peptidase [Allosphingosinicella sp.]|nr:S8 family serine peptidase [Allosphingosinicella sp.]
MTIPARWRPALAAALAFAICTGADAQLLPPVPDVGGTLGSVGQTARDTLDRTGERVDPLRATLGELADARTARLEGLVRANRDRLEMTDLGPAVRGQVIAIDPDPAALADAERAGFVRIAEERIEGLDIRSVTLAVPRGWSVDRALSRLRRLAPTGEFTANSLHEQSGAAAAIGAASLAQGGRGGGAAIGIIDGGVAAHPSLRSSVQQRGFVGGAPRPSGHGTAIASLIAGQGPVRGAAPGSPLLVADVYGSDPAGGNALALARALGWMVAQRVPVVAVSLVGRANPLVERAIGQARARGTWVVAAVGNDGRAAPPAYPASYPGVLAVTGVDGRGRVLIEAGRALHLDYAAPGADMAAAGPAGNLVPVRGTSFAVPLVAGRLAQHIRAANPVAALDREAQRGGRGVGRGVICGNCRTPVSHRSPRQPAGRD